MLSPNLKQQVDLKHRLFVLQNQHSRSPSPSSRFRYYDLIDKTLTDKEQHDQQENIIITPQKQNSKKDLKQQMHDSPIKKLNYIDLFRQAIKEYEQTHTMIHEQQDNVKRSSYTMYEDLRLLNEFTQSQTILNSTFKQIANSGVVNRSYESIKSRYTDYLKHLKKEDFDMILAYYQKHGMKGYLVFSKDSNGQRKLVKISKTDPKLCPQNPDDDPMFNIKVEEQKNNQSGVPGGQRSSSQLLPFQQQQQQQTQQQAQQQTYPEDDVSADDNQAYANNQTIDNQQMQQPWYYGGFPSPYPYFYPPPFYYDPMYLYPNMPNPQMQRPMTPIRSPMKEQLNNPYDYRYPYYPFCYPQFQWPGQQQMPFSQQQQQQPLRNLVIKRKPLYPNQDYDVYSDYSDDFRMVEKNSTQKKKIKTASKSPNRQSKPSGNQQLPQNQIEGNQQVLQQQQGQQQQQQQQQQLQPDKKQVQQSRQGKKQQQQDRQEGQGNIQQKNANNPFELLNKKDKDDAEQLDILMTVIGNWMKFPKKELIEKFHQLSGDLNLLDEYLSNKKEGLLWSEEEDDILKNVKSKDAKELKLLIKTKGLDNVKRRVAYLELDMPFITNM